MSEYKKYLHVLPEYMRGAMERYIDHGIEPGSFLNAVLCNDLRTACSQADETNRYIIFDYVKFLYNYAPADCWGSPKHYQSWVERGGLYAKTQETTSPTD